MKADTLDVINYVTSSYSVDKNDIGIFGYSMGGRITLELLAQKSYNFAAVEFVAPAEDTADLKALFGGEAKWSEMKAEAQKNGYATFTTIYGQTQQLSYKWFTDLEATSNRPGRSGRQELQPATAWWSTPPTTRPFLPAFPPAWPRPSAPPS
jgi:pimeloyl-ACP methyl ester carboxylesterase